MLYEIAGVETNTLSEPQKLRMEGEAWHISFTRLPLFLFLHFHGPSTIEVLMVDEFPILKWMVVCPSPCCQKVNPLRLPSAIPTCCTGSSSCLRRFFGSTDTADLVGVRSFTVLRKQRKSMISNWEICPYESIWVFYTFVSLQDGSKSTRVYHHGGHVPSPTDLLLLKPRGCAHSLWRFHQWWHLGGADQNLGSVASNQWSDGWHEVGDVGFHWQEIDTKKMADSCGILSDEYVLHLLWATGLETVPVGML